MTHAISRVVLKFSLLAYLCVGMNAQTQQTHKSTPSVNTAAQKAAQQLWNSILTKCGDTWYYSGSDLDLLMPGEVHDSRQLMWAHKGVRFTLSALTVPYAETLNGVSWKGLANMRWAAQRFSKDGEWDKWEAPNSWSYGYEVLIENINGQWFYQTAGTIEGHPDSARPKSPGLPQISATKLASTPKPLCDAAGNIKPPIKEQQPQQKDPRIKTPDFVPGLVPRRTPPQGSNIKRDGQEFVASNRQLQR